VTAPGLPRMTATAYANAPASVTAMPRMTWRLTPRAKASASAWAWPAPTATPTPTGGPNAPGRASCSTCSYRRAYFRVRVPLESFHLAAEALVRREPGGAGADAVQCPGPGRRVGGVQLREHVPGSAAARQRRVRLGISAPVGAAGGRMRGIYPAGPGCLRGRPHEISCRSPLWAGQESRKTESPVMHGRPSSECASEKRPGPHRLPQVSIGRVRGVALPGEQQGWPARPGRGAGGRSAGFGRPGRGRRGQGIKTSFPRTWPP
jgi:hypothetical protein